jgi:outer membrane protein TolC
MKGFSQAALLIWLALSPFGMALAQPPQPLSIEACIRLGLQSNVQVAQADLDVDKSREFAREQLANAYPQLGISAQFTDNLRLAQVILPGEIFGQPGTFIPVQFGVKYTLNNAAQLTQVVFNQSVFTGLKAASESVEVSELAAQRTREQVAYDIAALYYSAQVNRVQLGIVDANLRQLDSLMRITQLTVAAGTGMKVDFSRLQVNQTNLLTQRRNLEQAYEQQVNLLRLQMGISPREPFSIGEEIALEPWMQEAMSSPDPSQSTELKLLDKQVMMNEYNVRIIRNGYVPSLAFFATASLQAQSNEFNFWEDVDSKWFSAVAIGASLNIPVFDGFRRSAQIRQAQVDLLKAQQSLRNARDAYDVQFFNAQRKLETARAATEAQQANRALAEEVYQLSRLRYQQGVAPLSDVLTAETSMKEAQTNYLSALVQQQLAWLEWMRYSGNIERLTRL